MTLSDVKQISILDYLQNRGFTFRNAGKIAICKSPFSKDTNWSFCVYTHTNSFYDWSQGFGGSIIDLVMAMEGFTIKEAIEYLKVGNYTKYQPNYKANKARINKDFEYTRYLTHDKEEIASIVKYAHSRGIYNGYECGFYYVLVEGEWVRVPSLAFLHRDETGKICGVKFRKINELLPKDKENNARFSSRGKMAFYTLEYVEKDLFGEPTLYVVEGEANANSLWQYCQETKRNCVVISFGGVGNLPDSLPEKYKNLKEKKLIIDFDGSEELYNKRVKNYERYNLTPVKMVLPKGEDINSLYQKQKMNLIEHLL